MDDIVIGIDLGTTNSCAAYYMNGKLKILENQEGDRLTPSCIFFTEKNKPIVGKYAKKMTDLKPEYGIYEIKRLVGRKFDDPYVQNNLQYFSFRVTNEINEPVVVIEQEHAKMKRTPLELCTLVLSKIRKDVEEKLGHKVDKAVLTVPAYFNISQREVTLAAANKAGFTVLKLLNEPTASALSYYFENDSEVVNHSLVYDLGGGTFDVAILKRNASNIDIIAVDGDTHLGGQDFDNLLFDYVCQELKKRYKYDPKQDRWSMRRLRNQCEEAKKSLSILEETSIVLEGFVKNHSIVEIPLTRSQFENMANQLFQRTIDIVDKCLKSCNIKKSAIKEVILSGGSTRIPKIQEMLSNYFNNKTLNKFVNPDECVAEGAALQAAMLSTNLKQKIDQITITDVTPLSLGLRNFVDMMTFLIKKNTPLPVSQSSTRVTVYDLQNTMSFEIYEGERLNARKNHCLGKMTITGITPAPPGQCEVIFTMTIDNNGILKVTAKENYRDNVKDLQIVYTRGHRSDSEVKNALKDAEEHKEEDERFRRFAYLKEYVMNYCIRCIYNFETKKLVDTYKEAYDMCKVVKVKAEYMEMENEKELQQLQQDIKLQCHAIAEEFKFQYMPNPRT